MADSTFGRRILGQPPATIIALEQLHQAHLPFPELDTITGEMVLAALSGQRVAVLTQPDRSSLTRRAGLQLPGLTGRNSDVVREVFALKGQQRRGAWFLSEEETVSVGNANLPYYSAHYPRFASGVARDQKAVVSLAEPEAFYFWAVLDPFFADLFRPLDFRGPSPPKGDAAAQREAWNDVDAAYAALGIDGGEPLTTMRYGGGWSRLRSPEQVSTKQSLLEQIRRTLKVDVAARSRTRATSELVTKYYERAKRAQPLMRQVLAKRVQRTLAAFFGGDWLAFLRYIGEAPNPGEQISVALPEPRLYVDAAAQATTVAARHGVPRAEVERILAAFWESETPTSPVHRRVGILRSFWEHFDAVHARQEPGMRPLWGFLELGEWPGVRDAYGVEAEASGYHPGSYRTLLPAELLAEIERLWDGLMLPAYPDRIVSAPNPYWNMTESFGVALRFWHEAALTTWFVSEGPRARTDMPGLAKYHARDLKELEELGCPVDPVLFSDLIAAERRLGPPVPIEEDKQEHKISAGGLGITLTLSTSAGSRRAGFERLRNVLSRHRAVWARDYLEAYFRARWETQLRSTAREYHRLHEVKRKAPTLKQFAKFAERPANHWFSGDVSQLYRAIGEKAPVTPARARYLREPAVEFANRVFGALGGRPTRWEEIAATIKGDDREKQDSEWRAHQSRVSLAGLSIRYVQLREALDRPPTLKQFGETRFLNHAPALDPGLSSVWNETPLPDDADSKRVADVTKAWERYGASIEHCLATGQAVSEPRSI